MSGISHGPCRILWGNIQLPSDLGNALSLPVIKGLGFPRQSHTVPVQEEYPQIGFQMPPHSPVQKRDDVSRKSLCHLTVHGSHELSGECPSDQESVLLVIINRILIHGQIYQNHLRDEFFQNERADKLVLSLKCNNNRQCHFLP